MTKKDDTIKEFTALKGVGKNKAELLYNHGFNSLQKLKKTSVDDLVKVKGITKKNAQDILSQLQEKKPDTKKTQKKTETKKESTKPNLKKDEKDTVTETQTKPEETVEIVEPEGKYHVKKKPELTDKQKQQLIQRKHIKSRTPRFLRDQWFRYKRIPMTWRRPRGITSKFRMNKGYRPSLVRIGFRGPKDVRGLHSSGFEEVLVHNVLDLQKLNPKTQAARVGGTVGTRKRIDIAKKAAELDIRILNMKV
ncbi:MAG: 50S ribosomal protein L32e [Euryarchaeota archaeon]|nr:50S ribosomal protein L32e [Euryarchaeota archaeon]